MKRCSFIICSALILMLAMPMTVDAAADDSHYLQFADGRAGLAVWYREPGVVGGPYHYRTHPIYFIICEDGFHIAFDMDISHYSHGFMMSLSDSRDHSITLNTQTINCVAYNESYEESNGVQWDFCRFVAWGDQFGFDKSTTYASNSYFYTANNEEELVALFDKENSVGSFYKLYGLEQDYTEAVDFFQKPPVTGVLEKNLKTVMKTVDPLTEVVKILPIGLVCLVGWIALRKGLSLLRQVLFPA